MTDEPFDIKKVLATAKTTRPLDREKQQRHEKALAWVYLAGILTLCVVPHPIGASVVIGMLAFLLLWSFLRMGRLQLGRDP